MCLKQNAYDLYNGNFVTNIALFGTYKTLCKYICITLCEYFILNLNILIGIIILLYAYLSAMRILYNIYFKSHFPAERI